MKLKFTHWVSVLVVVVMILPMLATNAFAATTVSPIDGCVTVTDSAGNGSLSSGTVTITASGGYFSQTTNTVTITNSGSNKAFITFDYSASNYSSFSESSASGTKELTLAAGGTATITIAGKKAWSSNTATLTLSNFTYTAIVEGSANITYNEYGSSVTVGGTAVANGGSSAAITGDGADLVATPVSGATFVAWINKDTNEILSQSTTYNLKPYATSMNIEAVFTKSTETPYYKVGTTLYTDLSAAITAASSATVKTVALISDGTMPTGEYTIPSGVTLLAPYVYSDISYATTTSTVEGGWNSTLEYANTTLKSDYTHDGQVDNILLPNKDVTYTLTIPSGTTVNVASGGKFIIGGTIASGHINTAGIVGATAGAHSNVQLEGTLNVSGILSSCGYVLGGGTMNVNSGGTIYQPFAIMDHRDGHYAVISNNDKCFPFNRYSLQNIQCDIHMVSGAVMKGYFDIYTMKTTASVITVQERHNVTCGTVIAASDALINLTSGSLDISYDASRYANDSSHNGTGLYNRVGTSTLNFSGDASLGSIALTINVAGSDYSLSTSTDYFSLPYNFILNLNSGTFTIGNKLKMMPGSQMYVNSGATLNITGALAVMDGFRDHGARASSSSATAYTTSYHYPINDIFMASPVSGSGVADLVVNGGTINITGTLGGVVQTKGSGTVNMNGTNSLTLNVGSPSADKIMAILSTAVVGRTTRTLTADLFNLNGERMTMESGKSYVATDSNTHTIDTFSYTLYNSSSDSSSTVAVNDVALNATVTGTWKCETCTDENNDHICDICGKENLTECADGEDEDTLCDICGKNLCTHEGEKTATAEVAATCETDGIKAYWQCSGCEAYFSDEACTAVIEDLDAWKSGDGKIAALGHTSVTDAAVAPSCTTTGLTEGSHCSVCNAVLVAQEEVAALGHTEVIDAAVRATCTETGLTEGKHCSVCGEVLVAQTEVAALGHDYAAVVTAPTCTEQGYTTHTCACGDSYVDSYVDATGHTWDNGTVTTPATCSTTGVKTFNCTVDGCNGIKTETVDKNPDNHKLVTDAAVAATCTTPGLTEGKHCEDCGAVTVTQTEVPALGHTEVVDAASAPTCTETGLTQGSHCSVCNEVLVAREVVAALGHAYGDGVITTAPTCTATGVRTFTCGTCGDSYTEVEDATGHSAVEVPAVAATCEATGLTAGTKCQTCGTTITAQQTVAALGHNFVNYTSNNDATCVSDGTKTATCTRCDATDTVADVDSRLGHDFQNYTSDNNATCAADGTKTAKCTRCDATDTIDDEGSQTTVHTWGEFVSNNDASCTKNGTETATCTVCNATTTQEDEDSQLDHTYSSVVTAPTCTASGYTTNTCECGDTYTSDEVAALGHTEVAREAVAATCTESGLTAGVYCSVCSESLVEQEVVPALGHSYSSAVTAPTCTEQGYTTYTCSACGDSYVADEVAAAGHTYNAVVTASTCTEAGYTTYTCTVCGDSYVGDEVDAAGHTYNAVVTAPTCTEDGYTTYTCACGDSYVADKVSATGHSYGEWVQTTAPTCTKDGEKTRTCACGNQETETVSALGHTDGDPVVENKVDATCGNTGSYDTVVYCVVCKVEVSRVTTTVAALGHNYNDGVVTTEPTCIAEGVKTFTCGTCGDTYTETIAAQGHDEVSHEAKAPTCIEPGWDAYVTCSRCDYTTYEEKAATGEHSDSAEDADHICDTEGCTEVMNGCTGGEATCKDLAVCEICGEAYGELDPENHVGGTTIKDASAATCTTTGYTGDTYCLGCDTKIADGESIPTASHHYSSSVTKEATCVEAGVRTYTCSGCGSSYTEEIPVTDNHDWKAATYTAPKTCSVCKLTEGEPLVDVENPENIPVGDIEEALDAMVKVTDAIQPEDSGMEADTNKDQLEETTTAAGGISYNTSLVITLNAVVVDKDGEAMIVKKITYDVIPMLHILNEAGIQIDEQKITSFESEITFRLPVDKNTTAGFARVWHAETEDLGLHKIQTDADGNKFVEVKSKKFSEFTLELEEECTEHTYGEDGKCTICGAEEPVVACPFDFGQTTQVWLREPWALRVNLRVFKTNADGSRGDRYTNEELAQLTEYGVYFVRESDLNMGDVGQNDLTVDDIVNHSDAVHYTNATGKVHVDTSINALSCDFTEGIYTYQFYDSIFVLYYVVEDGETYYAGIRERNMSEIVNNGITDTKNYSATERAIFAAMAKLEEDIVARVGNTQDSVPLMDAPTLKENPLNGTLLDYETSMNDGSKFGHTTAVILVEPWGIELNGRVKLSKEFDDYGLVVYHDPDHPLESVPTAEELFTLDNAHVFSFNNGDATVNVESDGRTKISAIYNSGLYTYQMEEPLYVAFYVQDGDNIYYGPVKERTIKSAINSRLAVSGVANTLEGDILNDMLVLYEAVLEHLK